MKQNFPVRNLCARHAAMLCNGDVEVVSCSRDGSGLKVEKRCDAMRCDAMRGGPSRLTTAGRVHYQLSN